LQTAEKYNQIKKTSKKKQTIDYQLFLTPESFLQKNTTSDKKTFS